MFAKVKREMPGLQESAYRREAARRMGLDYQTYLKAWKKPPKLVEPPPIKITPAPQPVIRILKPTVVEPGPAPLMPTELTFEKARDMYRAVKREMPSATDAVLRREAARRLNVDYKDYLKAWKKPVSDVSTRESLASRTARKQAEAKASVINIDDPIWPRFEPVYGGSPRYRSEMHNVNPNRVGSSKKEWDMNCPSATTSFELRMRGYDVEAVPMTQGAGMYDIYKSWNVPYENMLGADAKRIQTYEYIGLYHNPLPTQARRIDRLLTQQPAGARGAISVEWRSGGAHIFNWVRVEHQYVLIDAQTRHTYDLFDLLPKIEDRVFIARLDNVKETVELDWLTKELGEHRAILHQPSKVKTSKMTKHEEARKQAR